MVGITVAIPFYNADTFLEDAIRSVFAQTFVDWELLLVDDGSVDNSLAIARAVDDPRVQVFTDGQNRRLAARLNQITALARYPLIARMDADDLMSPDRLQVQHDILAAEPDLDLVATGIFSISDDRRLIGGRGRDQTGITFADIAFGRAVIPHPSLLARRAWHERNPYEESATIGSEDTDLWLRSSLKGDFRIRTLASPLYVYREEQNLKASKMLRAYRCEREVFSHYFDDPQLRRRYLARSYLKSARAGVLGALGLLGILQRGRNPMPLTQELGRDYANVLKVVDGTKVPGLD